MLAKGISLIPGTRQGEGAGGPMIMG